MNALTIGGKELVMVGNFDDTKGATLVASESVLEEGSNAHFVRDGWSMIIPTQTYSPEEECYGWELEDGIPTLRQGDSILHRTKERLDDTPIIARIFNWEELKALLD